MDVSVIIPLIILKHPGLILGWVSQTCSDFDQRYHLLYKLLTILPYISGVTLMDIDLNVLPIYPRSNPSNAGSLSSAFSWQRGRGP
jgi:hypothetical protein